MTNEIEAKVAINLRVVGEPAKWLAEWKQRGLVQSYTDAVLQGLVILRDKINEQDLKAAKLREVEDRL